MIGLGHSYSFQTSYLVGTVNNSMLLWFVWKDEFENTGTSLLIDATNVRLIYIEEAEYNYVFRYSPFFCMRRLKVSGRIFDLPPDLQSSQAFQHAMTVNITDFIKFFYIEFYPVFSFSRRFTRNGTWNKIVGELCVSCVRFLGSRILNVEF